MSALASLLISYGVGCLSFAALASRLKGVDIRAHGSGNPGATNVGRILGRGWGAAVLLLDIAKGLVPVALLSAPRDQLGLGGLPDSVVDPEGRVLIAAAAVVGHIYPITARFRGGKGVATLVGTCLALDVWLALGAGVVHQLLKRASGFVSLASVGLAWSFPVAQLVLSATPWGNRLFVQGRVVMAALALLVTLRHLDNFRRIRAGSEDRYDGRSNASDTRNKRGSRST